MLMGDLGITSDSFEDGGVIPLKFGYKHGNVSPSLKFNNVPEDARSLALVMDDPDAVQAVGKVWVHWVVYNVEPGSIFEENRAPPGCVEGTTDFETAGYGGPAPPDREHTYIFKLYALDQRLDSKENLTKTQLEDLMKGHIISQAKLAGRYSP